MKKILWIVLLSTTLLNAQSDLKFDKQFLDCEDKWVVLPNNKEGKHFFGFVYFDNTAGFTLESGGTFTIDKKGKYVVNEKTKNSFKKFRLKSKHRGINVAILTTEKLKELHLKETPNWLEIYKIEKDKPESLYTKGFQLNAWGKCKKALIPLKKAYHAKPENPKYGVEICYSYNCLKEYDKAIPILKNVVKLQPKNSYAHKELIYSQVKLNQLKAAYKSIRKSMKQTDGKYNGENLYNLVSTYFNNKNYKKVKKLLPKAKRWNLKNKSMTENLLYIENQINK